VPGASAATPRCFGAAARDPERKCTNPALRLKVTPSPYDAPLVRSSPCAPQPVEGLVAPCPFGTTNPSPNGSFALFGDSHASQWRPALEQLGRRQRLRGVQLVRNGCSLTTVPLPHPEPNRTNCANWKAQAIDWLARHPEVTTVFLAHKTPTVDPFAPDQAAWFEARVQGNVDAWQWLPASVQRVYVMRDNPSVRTGTMDCVDRAVAKRRAPGKACAVPRTWALPPDPAVEAVKRAGPRFQLIDLTPFFCDTRKCYPVVGGVLVHKDVNHVTRRFAETLSPYIARALALGA
jgi:hypothetical protein